MIDLQQLWQERLPDELAFWDAWLASRGSCYGCDPDEFRARFDPTTPLQENLKALIGIPPTDTVHLLDVGAGPATSLGSRWSGWRVFTLALDPLAAEYWQLLQTHGLRAPICTTIGTGEELSRWGSPMHDKFDLAYSRNALDHSHDPAAAVANMYAAVKPGGVVYLLHHDYEAGRRYGAGLHQWDFFPDGDGSYAMVQYTAARSRADYRLRYPDMTMRAIGDQTEVIIRKPYA